MAMTSREVMQAAIHFKNPDRLPVMMPALGRSDVSFLWIAIPGKDDEQAGTSTDEYGCVWTIPRGEVRNMGQVTGHPITSMDQASTYPLPDWSRPEFFPDLDKIAEESYNKGLYVATGHFMLLFERMHALCGFGPLLEALYLEPEASAILADRLVENVISKVEILSRRYGRKIQALNCSEDWGTQQSLMISPEKWCEFFKPRYKRIFDAVHAQGWDMWMHSCGKINPILPHLHEVGLNIINLQQPRALGIEEVGKLVRGKLCFEGVCDIQRTLPTGDAKLIEQDVIDLLKHWAAKDGGFIVSDYGDGAAINAGPEAKQTMLDLFMKHDPYRK